MPRTKSLPKTDDLTVYEEKIYSQNGEDGIIKEILNRIGTDSRYAVEFGVEDGAECNTRLLKEQGWEVLQMDGGGDNPPHIKQEFITAENINDLFKKYEVPPNLDLLSIDIDFNDFWVWQVIDRKYQPRLVIVEYNATIPPDRAMTVKYNGRGMWDGTTDYFGASLLALYRLGKSKGYSLVYCDKKGVNAFFVRDDLLSERLVARTPEEVYREVGYVKHVKSPKRLIEVTDKMYHRKPRNYPQKQLYRLTSKVEAAAPPLKHRLLQRLHASAWLIKSRPALSLRRLGFYGYLKLKRKLRLDQAFYPGKPSNVPIDILIPVIEKDIQMLGLAIDGAKKHILHPISRIYLVGPDKSPKLKALAKRKGCTFVAEEKVLPFSKSKIRYVFNGENRSGWVYQMLLKLSADKVCTEENILVLDADTMFIAPQAVIRNGRPLFNLSDEYNQPYYDMNQRLLGLQHRPSRSFITHYMVFNTKALQQLRADLEAKWRKKWYNAVLDNLDRSVQSSFSEYELYGDYYCQSLKLPAYLNYWSNISLGIDDFENFPKLVEQYKDHYKSISLHNYVRSE